MIRNRTFDGSRWHQRLDVYVVPKPDFEGVRAEVETNAGTFNAWFPFMDHCVLNDSQWWMMALEVEIYNSSSLRPKLRVHNCNFTCEIIVDPNFLHLTNVQIMGLKLFGRGPSKWTWLLPSHPCKVGDASFQSKPLTLPTCNIPPHHGYPIESSVSGLAILVVMLMIVMVVTLVLFLLIRHRKRQENVAESGEYTRRRVCVCMCVCVCVYLYVCA